MERNIEKEVEEYTKKEEPYVPYYLIIHTNAYTGNFERELIAYCLGKLDDVQSTYALEYIKAFWNKHVGNGIDSYDEYLKFKEEYDFSDSAFEVFAETTKRLCSMRGEKISDEEIVEKFKKVEEARKKREEETDWGRVYNEFLCYTMQEVDDDERETFYNIESYIWNREYFCDTIYIQLNKPLPEYFENIVVERIKGFFEQDVFNTIRKYQWLCSFAQDCKLEDENYQLFDLELVDHNRNMVKKYI